MTLTAPRNNAWVGGLTPFVFDGPLPVNDVQLFVNDIAFHFTGTATGALLDLNPLPAGIPLRIRLQYPEDQPTWQPEITVMKPPHDLAGMGATVIRYPDGEIAGTFFKCWLPQVKQVFVRGLFNGWTDANPLAQLGGSGYWYGFSADARPGQDYRFFVYTQDGCFREVSDPAARATVKTRHNSPDKNDANAVILDPAAFDWKYDAVEAGRRQDVDAYNIYQLHWGTFLRKPATGNNFVRFVSGDTDADKRKSAGERLRYIAEMGFTAIELLPVHQANGDYNAGYDPSFFFAIETAYAREGAQQEVADDLRILVDEAHRLGLAVVFDAVINHLTRDETYSSFSQAYLKKWYIREDAPWSNHNLWKNTADWGPDPDFDRMEICNLLRDCLRMYFDEFHVDGIRLDATTTIPQQALAQIIRKLREEYVHQGKYLIAEHLTDDPFPYIVEKIGCHAGWYKPAFSRMISEVIGPVQQGDLSSLRQVFETNSAGRPATAIKYLLGSHDEIWRSHGGQATLTRLGGSGNFYARSKMRLAWAINACALGTPMFFMGTEGLKDTAWDNYDGYRDWDWLSPEESDAGRFRAMIRDINGLRKTNGALRSPNSRCRLVHWDEKNGVLAYKRWDLAGAVLLIVINVSGRQWERQEYQVQTGTPDGTWNQVFNTQDAAYGGWDGSGNAFAYLRADHTGNMQGINVPKWSLLLFRRL